MASLKGRSHEKYTVSIPAKSGVMRSLSVVIGLSPCWGWPLFMSALRAVRPSRPSEDICRLIALASGAALRERTACEQKGECILLTMTASPAIAQLLALLDEAFDRADWHSLIGNLRPVTNEDWHW